MPVRLIGLRSWERRADELHERTYSDTALFTIMARDMCVLRRCAEELLAEIAKSPNENKVSYGGETARGVRKHDA